MASSNNSKTENKKTKNAKQTSKTMKQKDSVKKVNKNKNDNKKKKLKLSSDKSKRHEDESLVVPSSSIDSQQQEDQLEENDTVFTNGRSSAAKPKESRKKREEEEENDEGDAKTAVFPMNRIRTMIKGEDPELRVSQEAILAINKAAEKFLEQFTQDAYARTAQERKKSLSYNHLASVVSMQRRYEFLSDFVPEKLKAEDALRETNSRGNGGN